MKIKKDKQQEKRSHENDERQEETALKEDEKKSKKKRKLNNAELVNGDDEIVTKSVAANKEFNSTEIVKADKAAAKTEFSNAKIVEGDDETATQSTAAKDKSLKTMDVSIFKHFKELTSDVEKTRMEAALHLLQQIHRTKDTEKRQKELAYTLKRLVRGCGASTNISRAGFFTGLVGFLKSFSTQEVGMEQVLQTLNKELHVGATIANKEDADAVVGKILVCGALLNSGRLTETNREHLEQITNILLQCSRHRTYHASLGFSFLCEIIEALSQQQFESCVWPLVRNELTKPWSKQTLQTVHCLICVQKKFPNIVNRKFLKINFGGTELLNHESFQYLHKIFWEHSNTDILTHPAFESFGSYIATSKYLVQFWCETVEPGLANPTKLLEIETLKILTDILENINVEQSNVYELLSDNFMHMFVEGLKNVKQKKDETLKAFYDDFLESLVKCCAKLKSDANKVAVIKRLILPPGIFNIEKFTGYRIIHQLINSLGEDGVREAFKLYKSIFLANLVKDPQNSAQVWLNFERLNAGYMLQNLLQHKSIQASYKWREKQLKFLFTCGVFYVDDAAEICKKEAAGSFSKDFAEQCKNIFYTCLQTKLNDIQQEQKLLFNLAKYCQEKMLQKHAAKYFRIQKFNDSLQKTWKNMFDNVTQRCKTEEQEQSDNKLQTVFNILLLNMGLQLFRDAEMAIPAVDDLLKCMEKSFQQAKIKKKLKKITTDPKSAEHQQEPKWIEVVVDLFLHLLSQNNNALRNIVNVLFPHLCHNLTLTAVHQILSVLDMKDGNNPLSTKNDDHEEDENDGEEEEVEEEVPEKESQENGVDSESDENEEDEDDEEDDDEPEEVENDNEDEDGVTANDKLRNAISQALIANGSAAAIDDDMASVDLNEMTEEEGRKLDEALANAFKALKKSNNGTAQTKKSKNYRIKTTTVMHFRIRVLDLIEIYLQQKPSLLFGIEIMLALYNILEYCVGDELKPLQIKVEKVLTKITTHKNYTNENEVKEENFVDFLRLIVEKKTPAIVYDIVNRMRNKCSCFLITNAYKINSQQNTAKILKLCQEYNHEFLNSRNPTINITLLIDIFKLRWRNVWNIAEDMIQQGLNLQTRTFRRIQIYEILCVLYRNTELHKQEEDLAKKHLTKIDKILSSHIKALSKNDSGKHSAKEFLTLLDLLLIAQKVQQRLQLPSILTSENTLNSLQNIRKHIRLESTQIYQRFCNIFKLQIIRNSDIPSKSNALQNNTQSEIEVDVERIQKNVEQEINTDSIVQKRKLEAKDSHKLKKAEETATFRGGVPRSQRWHKFYTEK